MNILSRVKCTIEYKYYELLRRFNNMLCRRKYADWKDDEYNIGSLKHIWGITSYDNLTGSNANLYTMNDIDITYDRESKLYMLGVETAYCFKSKEGECEYLENLLKLFEGFMDKNNYDKNFDVMFYMLSPSISMRAESIEELYAEFRIFVEGFCAVYRKGEN